MHTAPPQVIDGNPDQLFNEGLGIYRAAAQVWIRRHFVNVLGLYTGDLLGFRIWAMACALQDDLVMAGKLFYSDWFEEGTATPGTLLPLHAGTLQVDWPRFRAYFPEEVEDSEGSEDPAQDHAPTGE